MAHSGSSLQGIGCSGKGGQITAFCALPTWPWGLSSQPGGTWPHGMLGLQLQKGKNGEAAGAGQSLECRDPESVLEAKATAS